MRLRRVVATGFDGEARAACWLVAWAGNKNGVGGSHPQWEPPGAESLPAGRRLRSVPASSLTKARASRETGHGWSAIRSRVVATDDWVGRFCCKPEASIWYGESVSQKRPALFRGRHFEDVVILLCVRWYLRYSLSYRDLQEMMAERGLSIDHVTIWRWVQRYAPVLNQRIRREMRRPNRSWRVDETYVKVAGNWAYLYRAVDSSGARPSNSCCRPIAGQSFKDDVLVWRPCGGSSPRVINVDGLAQLWLRLARNGFLLGAFGAPSESSATRTKVEPRSADAAGSAITCYRWQCCRPTSEWTIQPEHNRSGCSCHVVLWAANIEDRCCAGRRKFAVENASSFSQRHGLSGPPPGTLLRDEVPPSFRVFLLDGLHDYFTHDELRKVVCEVLQEWPT